MRTLLLHLARLREEFISERQELALLRSRPESFYAEPLAPSPQSKASRGLPHDRPGARRE
jgi:hypothetical protein